MNYNDFYLVPRMSVVSSRSECDTSIEFGEHKFKLPIVPSNMETVIDVKLAEMLTEQGYFYILHRFMDYDLIRDFVRDMNELDWVSSISIGVNPKDYGLVDNLIDNPPDFITLDIANAHSTLAKQMILYIKEYLPDTFLIAGNVGSVGGMLDLERWGASAVKISVGNGSACETTRHTGFYAHSAGLLNEMTEKGFGLDIPIIADGGVREISDISKAMVLGADIVMIGGVLSGFDESPGEVYEIDGQLCKIYAGSTANNIIHVEGKSIHTPLKGSLFDYLDVVEQNLKSSISYAGGKDLSAFNHVEIKRY